MSRNYAQIFTAIWRDPDFIALRESTQRAYLMLVTQPGISAAGVLPLTLRRWAKLAEDSTIASLRADLVLLHRAGMIVVDEDTEELLVRSFVRHDNGYRNPRRQPSIRDAANEVESARLRRVLADELTRLGCPRWMVEMGDPPDGGPDSGAGMPVDVFPQVDSHSDSHSDPREDIDGMAIPSATARTTTHNPQPTTLEPEHPSDVLFGDAPKTQGRAKGKRAATTSQGSRIPDDFALTDKMRAWAKERMPQVNADLETEKFVNHWQAKSGKDATKVRWDLTWQNWMHIAAERSPNTQNRLNGGMTSGSTRRLHNSHENQDRYDVKL